ncbi:hypothetical protein OROMI_016609 [Orobanche minor]
MGKILASIIGIEISGDNDQSYILKTIGDGTIHVTMTNNILKNAACSKYFKPKTPTRNKKTTITTKNGTKNNGNYIKQSKGNSFKPFIEHYMFKAFQGTKIIL